MAKEEKLQISEEELKVVQEQQASYQKLVEKVGVAEITKFVLLGQTHELLPKIEEHKKALEEKYGSININVADGSYTKIEKKENE